ncbi:hypothetical protein Aduo_015982 [Ancylostoma duodenale]
MQASSCVDFGGTFQVGEASVIIMSDNESVHSNQSEDLFLNDEDSCDVADMVQAGQSTGITSFNDVDNPPGGDHSTHADASQLVSQHRYCSVDQSVLPRLDTNNGWSGFSPKSEGSESKVRVSGSPGAVNPTTAHDCGSLEQASHSSKECSLRDNMEQSIVRLEKGTNDGENTFGRYMQLKKDKLRYQVNVLDRPHSTTSEIFKGISIFVNGYTDPTALELRQLIQLHGGEYHCYYEYGVTSFVIATSLATTKVSKTRQNEKFVRPEWIVDSIAAGKLLDVEDYILLPAQKKGTLVSAFQTKLASGDQREESRILDARDPNFLEEYYARSRLHLISTLAQEMKDYVCSLRSENNHLFSGRDSIAHLIVDDYEPSSSRTIFHLDMDCFFVSVALRSRPDLVDKPVAITHSKGVGAGFSELACVSYAARRCGLRNGMIVRDAIKRCPQLVCLPYAFDEYRNVAKTVYTIVARYTLEIKAVSCDEMYIDCSKLFDELRIRDAASFAEHLRAEIRRETGCPASVGIGRSTLMARLATRYAKPDGVRHVPAEESDVFIANEKVRNLPGLGYQTYSKLVGAFGPIEKCSELHLITRNELERLLGKKAGDQLYKMCRGESEDKDFIATNLRKSVSCDINYGIRFVKKSEVAHFLKVVGLELEKKLASAKMATRSITLKLMIRCADAPVETAKYLGHGECNVQNKSASLDHPTGSAKVITTIALKLFTNMDPVITDLRGIGVQCGRLVFASDVGYSAKSEAINTMFRARENKKEEQRAAHAVQHQKMEQERELPMVFSTESPTFFGERNMVKIKDDMQKYLKNEPNEDAIGVITDFLFYLLRDGSLNTLISICLFIHRELYSTSSERTTDPEWIFAMNLIFNSLDEKCCVLYGAPAIQPAILNCKES